MDPEPEMIAEGRRRADAAGVENVSFVVGGSDDLPVDVGPLAAVTISQALHWMRDQDAVLRALAAMVDTVALVGYVKEPDYNLVWLERPPWDAVGAIARRHLADRGSSPAAHDPFPDILARSAFSDIELITHEYEAVVRPSIDAAVGYYRSLGYAASLDPAFEAEVRAALGDADTTPFRVTLVDGALVGRKP
jgi:Methyltransferase domain